MVEFAAHRPDELACSSACDHRAAIHTGRPAVDLNESLGGVVRVEQDIGGGYRVQRLNRGGRRPIAVDARAQVHVDAPAGVSTLGAETGLGWPLLCGKLGLSHTPHLDCPIGQRISL